jgi:hypothetical protein
LKSGGDTTAAELVLERAESAGLGFDQRNNRLMWLTSSSKFAIEHLRYRMPSKSGEILNISSVQSARLPNMSP